MGVSIPMSMQGQELAVSLLTNLLTSEWVGWGGKGRLTNGPSYSGGDGEGRRTSGPSYSGDKISTCASSSSTHVIQIARHVQTLVARLKTDVLRSKFIAVAWRERIRSTQSLSVAVPAIPYTQAKTALFPIDEPAYTEKRSDHDLGDSNNT